MRSSYRVNDVHRAHFITSTIIEWLPVFTTPGCCQILTDSLAFCRENKGLRIYAWVVMDNHFHAIVAGPDLPRTLQSLKRHTAQALLTEIQREGRDWLVNRLEYGCLAHKRREGSIHQLWQEGYHPQSIGSDAVMQQKLEYIHLNPVRRGLVAAPEHWRYSSAHEWLHGSSPVLRVNDWYDGEPQPPR
jgi:putative transposase